MLEYKPEMVEQKGLIPYFQRRLEDIEIKMRDPVWVFRQARRSKVFFRLTDLETERKLKAPAFHPDLRKWISVDDHGVIILYRWPRTKIKAGYEIIGTPQQGRDYASNPPRTKEPRELQPAEYKGGIEDLVRGIGHVLKDYITDESGQKGQQLLQHDMLMSRLSSLYWQVLRFGELNDQDLEGIVKENAILIEEIGLDRSKLPEKRAIQRSLISGFKDSRDRKNMLVATARLFSIGVNLLKIREGNLFHITSKYGQIHTFSILRREAIRYYLDNVTHQLGVIVDQKLYEHKDFPQFLNGLSREMARYVKVRPYVLAVHKAIEYFGGIDGELPPGTVRDSLTPSTIIISKERTRKIRGRERIMPSFPDALLKAQHILQLTLNNNLDYTKDNQEKAQDKLGGSASSGR